MTTHKKPFATIYVDIDGVLADYASQYIAATGAPIEPEDLHSWDSLLELTGTTYEQLRQIQADDGFLDNIELYHHTRSLLAWAESMGDEVILLTAVEEPERARWAARVLPGYELIQGPDKSKYAHPGALLIDDSAKNCHAFKDSGGQVRLFRQPWNLTELHLPFIYLK